MHDVVIRECRTIEELDSCVRLQRDVFGLPDLEISPRRHLIVSREAGGWTLGAFEGERLVGFVHHLAAVRGHDVFGYSHMMAVAADFQNRGVGAKLKWSQRARAIAEGRTFIKWTWDPMQARNAHFNLNRLGVTVSSYVENFYGTDYVTSPSLQGATLSGIDSDRLFASWSLLSNRVNKLSSGEPATFNADVALTITIPSEWTSFLKNSPGPAKEEQLRVRRQFQNAFSKGLVCAGFERSNEAPKYLFYRTEVLID